MTKISDLPTIASADLEDEDLIIINEDDDEDNGDIKATKSLTVAELKLFISANSASPRILYLKDVKANATTGNSLTNTSTWDKITLNDSSGDTALLNSLSSSVFTLATGTYEVWATTSGSRISAFQTRLRRTNNTAATLCLGGTCQADDGGSIYTTIANFMIGRITVNVGDTLEFQRWYIGNGIDAYGANLSGSGESEVYAQIMFKEVL